MWTLNLHERPNIDKDLVSNAPATCRCWQFANQCKYRDISLLLWARSQAAMYIHLHVAVEGCGHVYTVQLSMAAVMELNLQSCACRFSASFP